MTNELPVVFARNKKNTRVKKVAYFIYISFSLITALVLYYMTKISVVKCQLEQQVCPDEITKQLNLQNKSIFFTDIESLIQKVPFSIPIKLIEIKRYLPGKILLSFDSVEYLYQLKFADTHFFVDELGNLYPAQSQVELIKLEVDEHDFDQLIEKSRVKVIYHNQLVSGLNQLKKSELKIQQINLKDGTVVLKLQDFPQLLLTIENFSQGIANFILITQQIEINQYQPIIMEIDLRFDLPVLKETTSVTF